MSNGGIPKDKQEPEQSANLPAVPESEPSTNLVPGDDAYHDDKQLIAALTALNGQVSRYVLRYLDADAGRVVPTSVEDELALGERIVELGEAVRARAERRQVPHMTNGAVIEHEPCGEQP
jgi:hypothetical protein